MADAPKKVDRYKDSPTLKRGDDGNMKATKKGPTAGEKATSEDAAGTAGMPLHETHAKQQQERFTLYQKHDKELMDMYTRHQIEAGPQASSAEGE